MPELQVPSYSWRRPEDPYVFQPIPSEVHQGKNGILKLLPPLEKSELYKKRALDDFSVKLVDEINGGFHGPAGSEEVVCDDYLLSRLDRVLVNFELIGPVLELVDGVMGLVGELARFSNENNSRAKPVREGRTDDEASGLHPDNEIYPMPPGKNPRLSEAEIELLARWIEEGAPWPQEYQLREPPGEN